MQLDHEKNPELNVAGLHSGAKRIQNKVHAWKQASDRLAIMANSHDRLLVAKNKGFQKIAIQFYSKSKNTGPTVSVEFEIPEIIEKMIEQSLNTLRDLVQEFTKQIDEGMKDLGNDDSE